MKVNPELQSYLDALNPHSLTEERKSRLQPLIEFIQARRRKNQPIVLQFICTHNSRRSQFAQIWAYAAAALFGVPVTALSGGTEVTAFHPNAIASVKRAGFKVLALDEHPAAHLVSISNEVEPLKVFSKRFNDPYNAAEDFAAVMTCSDADENCPFIPGTAARIALNYEDPKVADGTAAEAATYDERQAQIAAEMYHVFAQIQ